MKKLGDVQILVGDTGWTVVLFRGVRSPGGARPPGDWGAGVYLAGPGPFEGSVGHGDVTGLGTGACPALGLRA